MINNDKFNQALLDKIKEKKIKPRWQFLLKDYVVWFFGVLSLLVGGAAFSIIFYMLRYSDWNVYNQIGESLLIFILLTLPYFWIALLAFFIALVYFNVKHTKKGYKYSLSFILLVDFAISALLGVLFFYAGVSQVIDDVIGERIPLYSKLINPRIDYWSKPEDGRLAGLVVLINEAENKFVLVDLNQNEWTVESIDEVEKMMIASPIRVFGKKISDNLFRAEMILPPGRPGMGMFNRHKEKYFPDGFDPIMRDKIIGDPELKKKLEKMPEILEKYPEVKDEMKKIRREEFNVGKKCSDNGECLLPFDYAIRSNCAFDSKCVDDVCRVVCIVPDSTGVEKNIDMKCESNNDCNCDFYIADDLKDCICFQNSCVAVVE